MSGINIVAAIGASFALVSSDAFAESSQVRKCYRDGRTLYQNAPCATTHVSLPYVDAATTSGTASPAPREHRVGVSQVDDAPGGPAVADIAEQWRQGALAPGMSDTVVLNRPKWGRPKAIARSRAPDGYREVWTYAADANGASRVLTFLNGRLAEIRFDEPPLVAPHASADDPRVPHELPPASSERPVVRVGATDSSLGHGASVAMQPGSEVTVSIVPVDAPSRMARVEIAPQAPRATMPLTAAPAQEGRPAEAWRHESSPTPVTAVPDTVGDASSEYETPSSFATSGVVAVSE